MLNMPKLIRLGSDAESETSDVGELLNILLQEITTNRANINKNSPYPLFKIHHQFSKSDKNAYTPMVLSIGPYHYRSNPDLLTTEKKKFDCLDYLVRLNCEKGMKDYLKAIKRVEREARECYNGEIGLDSINFQQMLLLDASFILVYLHGTDGIVPTKRVITSTVVPEITEEAADPVIKQGTDIGDWNYSCLVHDLLLLENQIPFVVVKGLYMVLTGTDDTTNLINNIAGFLEEIFSTYPKAIREKDRPKDFQHLLHLLHFYFRPTQMPVNNTSGINENMRLMRWRRALEYHEAGIEFKAIGFDKNNPNSLLDIKFSKGVVEMPCIRIDQNTSYLFRNFAAMEQTCNKFGNDITAYVIFIAQLMSTPDDVAFLARKGIVSHQLRSDQEASDHLTKLTEGIVFDFNQRYYTKEMCIEMEKWYKNRWNVWNAWLRQNHFKNPFMGLIASVGIVMFVCGIVQTVFTVLSFVKPQTIALVQTENGFKIAQ